MIRIGKHFLIRRKYSFKQTRVLCICSCSFIIGKLFDSKDIAVQWFGIDFEYLEKRKLLSLSNLSVSERIYINFMNVYRY